MPSALPNNMDDLLFPAFFDAAACILLAAASALRARHASCTFFGSCILGFLCGLLGPLLRSALMGQAILVLNSPLYAATAFGGAALGAFLGRFFWTEGRFFPLLDAAGLQLLSCSGLLVTLYWPLSPFGALLLSVISALAPSLLRDVALGDTAAFVDESAYATAPLLGALLTSVLLSLALPPLAALAIGWTAGFLVRALVIWQQR